MSASVKALIVDDDKNLTDSLKNTLVEQEIEVKITHSAQQAEQFLSFEQYDLLIVDVVLPKVNGIDFLKSIISKNLLHSNCKIWLMSGVISEKIVSKEVMNHVDSFLKKPLGLKDVKKRLSSAFNNSDDLLKNLPFFYLNYSHEKNFLAEKEYLIQNHELMFICFYLNSLSFDGLLEVGITDSDEKAKVLFKSGNIVNVEVKDPKSYIGGLLVKHNLVAKEVIKRMLSEESKDPLGVRLIEGCYVSPHSLNKVLKEQMIIKLFKLMEGSSVRVKCDKFEVSIEKLNKSIRLEMRDFCMLIDQWVKSYVDMKWLRDFFRTYEDTHFRNVKNYAFSQRLSIYPGLEFFTFDHIKGVQGVSHIINTSKKEKDQVIRELYCRLLAKEGCLEYTTEKKSEFSHQDYAFMKKRYESFLKDSESKNYFELLGLSPKSDIKEMESRYRSMVKNFHPDRRAKDMPKDIAAICDRCFFLLKKIYEVLSNPEEKRRYIAKLELGRQKSNLAVQSMYMEGKQKLRQGFYKESLNQFKNILQNKLAPNDTSLFYIWCRLKMLENNPEALKEEQDKLLEMFNNTKLEYKQSAAFFFVKGLFMKLEGNRKVAFECFTKATLVDPKLTAARIEKSSLGTKKKSKKASAFKGLFKKGA